MIKRANHNGSYHRIGCIIGCKSIKNSNKQERNENKGKNLFAMTEPIMKKIVHDPQQNKKE